jgi:hypothetical protein
MTLMIAMVVMTATSEKAEMMCIFLCDVASVSQTATTEQ